MSESAAEIALAMGPVAGEILGEPTQRSAKELRFGSRGSLSVDLTKGTWFDHEANEGGGVLDFVQQRLHLDRGSALTWLRERGHIEKQPAPKPKLGREIAWYDYTDECGTQLFQVVRFDPKDFRQRHMNGDGWAWGLGKGTKRVIYHLPTIDKLAPGSRVYVTEGEKAADALAALGLTATCSPMGANKWRNEYAEFLRGHDVVILPDNDDPGREHAAMVTKSLNGIAKRVRSLTLPKLPDKGDVVDWIAAGGTRETLEELVEALGQLDQPEPQQTNFDAAIKAVVNEFNERYLLVNEGGKAIIYQPGYDPVLKRRHFDRLSTRDLQTLYMNRQIKVGVDNHDRAIHKSAADLWLRHPDRRQYIHGVTFDPAKRATPGVLNLWEGFPVKPKAGDWSRMRTHIHNVICAGSALYFNYLMQWMARMFQRPAEQGEVAVVMRSGEGTGKGTLAKALMHLTGHHGLAISNGKHLTGNFNGHLRDVILLFADEALFAGDRQHIGALNSLITEPYLTIEAKFANAVQAPNFLHVMMASNEQWVVPAARDARRYFVLDVSEQMKGDHAYFGEIWKQMDAGGYEAMLHDLLTLDITSFNVRAVPTTEALQTQRKLSLQTTDAWWVDCLSRGYVFRSKLGLEAELAIWHPKISTELLFASYEEFAKAKGERRALSREGLGKFLTGIKAHPKKWRNATVGEHIANTEDAFGGKTIRRAQLVQRMACGYDIGSLEQARKSFTDNTGLKIVWDGGAALNDAAD